MKALTRAILRRSFVHLVAQCVPEEKNQNLTAQLVIVIYAIVAILPTK
jgi:hypothetical protein